MAPISLTLEDGALNTALKAIQDATVGDLVEINFDQFDGDIAIEVSAITACLMRALKRNVHLHLQHAPQVLLHGLYRVGVLPHANLHLTDPRTDLASAG